MRSLHNYYRTRSGRARPADPSAISSTSSTRRPLLARPRPAASRRGRRLARLRVCHRERHAAQPGRAIYFGQKRAGEERRGHPAARGSGSSACATGACVTVLPDMIMKPRASGRAGNAAPPPADAASSSGTSTSSAASASLKRERAAPQAAVRAARMKMNAGHQFLVLGQARQDNTHLEEQQAAGRDVQPARPRHQRLRTWLRPGPELCDLNRLAATNQPANHNQPASQPASQQPASQQPASTQATRSTRGIGIAQTQHSCGQTLPRGVNSFGRPAISLLAALAHPPELVPEGLADPGFLDGRSRRPGKPVCATYVFVGWLVCWFSRHGKLEHPSGATKFKTKGRAGAQATKVRRLP
eukprot:SAG22_NODE_56_length_23716_cov_11.146759_18_plen_357_part_00